MIKYRPRAQALVEFALVVILLMVLIFGIIEVARMLFMYAAVVTSSREAVRYGSVAGINDAGNLYYQDCVGIRDTARKLAFFQDLEDDDIDIAYIKDKELDTNSVPYCISGNLVDESVGLTTGDRIKVTIRARFNPIVNIIPLDARTIESSSTRTIMGIITLK